MFQGHLVFSLSHPWSQTFLQGDLVLSSGELSKTKTWGLGERIASKVLLLPGPLVDGARNIYR